MSSQLTLSDPEDPELERMVDRARLTTTVQFYVKNKNNGLTAKRTNDSTSSQAERVKKPKERTNGDRTGQGTATQENTHNSV